MAWCLEGTHLGAEIAVRADDGGLAPAGPAPGRSEHGYAAHLPAAHPHSTAAAPGRGCGSIRTSAAEAADVAHHVFEVTGTEAIVADEERAAVTADAGIDRLLAAATALRHALAAAVPWRRMLKPAGPRDTQAAALNYQLLR